MGDASLWSVWRRPTLHGRTVSTVFPPVPEMLFSKLDRQTMLTMLTRFFKTRLNATAMSNLQRIEKNCVNLLSTQN